MGGAWRGVLLILNGLLHLGRNCAGDYQGRFSSIFCNFWQMLLLAYILLDLLLFIVRRVGAFKPHRFCLFTQIHKAAHLFWNVIKVLLLVLFARYTSLRWWRHIVGATCFRSGMSGRSLLILFAIFASLQGGRVYGATVGKQHGDLLLRHQVPLDPILVQVVRAALIQHDLLVLTRAKQTI